MEKEEGEKKKNGQNAGKEKSKAFMKYVTSIRSPDFALIRIYGQFGRTKKTQNKSPGLLCFVNLSLPARGLFFLLLILQDNVSQLCFFDK